MGILYHGHWGTPAISPATGQCNAYGTNECTPKEPCRAPPLGFTAGEVGSGTGRRPSKGDINSPSPSLIVTEEMESPGGRRGGRKEKLKKAGF
ncbi:hypothetical protein AXF42_Ash004539 [Apostasia shenzhenica]|uniref:Uncharacterized protein n=1 Tax=Apostasia shenzhenica TaxID=1088818 RepID=A0A2I0BGX1_9ASPA|nr:hypothetical protein AXF42_Ash004539 [Apostasia shenzhenica]